MFEVESVGGIKMIMKLQGISNLINHDEFLKDVMMLKKKYDLWGEIIWYGDNPKFVEIKKD